MKRAAENDASKRKAVKPVKRPSNALIVMEDDGGERVYAQTQRASRAARPPSPTEEAKESAWRTAAELATRLEEQRLTRVVRIQPTVWRHAGQRECFRESRRGSAAAAGPASAGGTALLTAPKTKTEPDTAADQTQPPPAPQAAAASGSSNLTSHIMSLHSRGIDASNREPSFLSYYPVLPQVGTQLIQAALRSNSVRCSVVNKESSQGGVNRSLEPCGTARSCTQPNTPYRSVRGCGGGHSFAASS